MPTAPRIPLIVKIVYTIFVCILVPFYWIEYGPTNFLYFCDVALFMTLAALWLENPLLAAAPAVGIVLPQLAWQIDFLSGANVLGMTGYMFDKNISLFARGLSFFHFWLPILLVWMIWKLGFDRRGVILWTIAAWILLPVCYFFLPAPDAEKVAAGIPVNVNYVYGFDDKVPQTMMNPDLYFGLLLVALPLLVYLPTHFLFCRLFSAPEEKETEDVVENRVESVEGVSLP